MKKTKDHIYRLRVFIKDKNKKPFFKILKETLVLWYKKGRFPTYYFGRYLYRKEFKNYKNYISLHEYFSIIKSKPFNTEPYVHLLSNKLALHLFFKEHNIPSPTLLSYNHHHSFIDNNEVILIKTTTELIDFFRQKHLKNTNKTIFIKPLSSQGGTGIFIINQDNLENILTDKTALFFNDAYIHQEALEQHPEVNKIYSGAINTLRLDTFNDNGNVQIFGGVMRFGVNNNFVDNASKGGFYVPVNFKNGTLTHKGYSKMVYGAQDYTKHPNTDFEFNGFKIPFFNEAVTIVLKLCYLIPNKLCGWDIAITPSGPVVIEGNNQPAFIMAERGYGGYANHPVVKKMLSQIN